LDSDKKVELKEISNIEVKNTFDWLFDPIFKKFFTLRAEPNWNTHVEYFKKIKEDSTQKVYAIYADKKHIGNCGFKYIKDKTGELWIYIGDNAYRGKHLAKPACKLLIEKGKKELGINKIYLHVLKNNIVAIGLYESLNFVQIEMDEEDKKIWKDQADNTSKYLLEVTND